MSNHNLDKSRTYKLSNDIIKIAITGPESTGKTSLTMELAEEFSGIYVPEFARTYLADKGLNYDASDVLNIAAQQQREEENAYALLSSKATEKKILFCDTDLINIKIWLEDKNWEVPEWIECALRQSSFHHYFLMDIDLPWESDILRENPTRARYFFDKFEFYLNEYQKPYTVISGIGEHRKQKAIDFINSHYF